MRSATSSAYPRTSSTCGSIISCTPMKFGPTTFQCTCLSVRCRSLYVLSTFCKMSATSLPCLCDSPWIVNSVIRDVYPRGRAGNPSGQLDRAKVRYCLPGAEPRIEREPADLQQPHRPVPMWPQWLEQLHHRRIVDRTAKQAPADHLGQVVVPDAQRVGIAEGALGGLGRRPLPDSRQRHQRRQCLL